MLDIPKKEEEILEFWQDNNIFQKSLDKESPNGDYVFFEGPPTANGKPGLHHMLARVFKDVMIRYKTMQGFHVERKAGWDTHGLPVEIGVEKEIGISGKQDIEKFGIAEFNQKCRESVWKYKEEWEKFTERIGFWLDMKNPYITYENEYIESVWWALKEAWKKELLYLGYKVVPHCPRCETTLSSHEVAQGYKLVKEPSVYIKFKVSKGNKNVAKGEYILAWTTTPWTLPGNVALAVGEDIDYVKVKQGDDVMILAKSRVDAVFGKDTIEVLGDIKGSGLVGVEYEPLFPGALDAGDKKGWYVAPADFVTTEDGTGVVHTAVMYGVDDYELGLKIDLPSVHTVDENGKFVKSVTKWAGKFVKNKNVERGIVEDLEKRGLLLGEVDYEHDYPFCWRCDTPLLYYAKDSWFIKMTAVKEDLLKNADTINWHPNHIKKGRFGEWLEGVKDWALSRERYWGTPLPIWQCEACKSFECIGSMEELGQKVEDLHRPYIDEVKLKCDCGGEMTRVPEVIDTWFDSGSMPFAQHHYPFENKGLIDSGTAYPAEYISEAIDQTRGWFYTLLAISTFLGKGTSYKNVICLGLINDKFGKKMSKSKGNIVEPWEVINKYGVDSVRYHMYSINQPGEYKDFDERNVLQVSRQVVMTLNNVLAFYNMFSEMDHAESDFSKNVMDRWIIAKTHSLIDSVTYELNAYNITDASRAIGDFVNELSTWYIRRSRDRFKDSKQAKDALSTLRYVLTMLSRVMAPFMPFTSEYLWKELKITSPESVHLALWPTSSETDQQLLDHMKVARDVVEQSHAKRSEAGIKVRQPLALLEIDKKLPEEFLSVVAAEVNVKKVVVGKELKLDTEITDELKAEGAVRELVRSTNALRKKAGLKPTDSVIVSYETTSEFLLKQVIEAFGGELSKLTAQSIWEKTDSVTTTHSDTITIHGEKITIGF